MVSRKLKVATIVGTRPEIIRLSRIIAKFDEFFNHTLIHTGQNYDHELNQIFFEDLEIRSPDIFLECKGKNAADSISQVILKSDEIFQKLKPDAVLILGDTNSSLCAISAKRKKIPIFHMEAGNRCFDLRVPEEINRKIVDHIADINLPYSNIARGYLLNEGLNPDHIITTGSPMDEVLKYYSDKINQSDIISRLKLASEKFFLVSFHREENVDSKSKIASFSEALNKIALKYKLPIIVSTHPRLKKMISKSKINFHSLVRQIKPVSFTDYIKLQQESKVVLSDSGTITEESSILNFPALNIREAQERPEGFEEGSVMFTGLNIDRILQAIKILEKQPRGDKRLLNKVKDYEAQNVSEKIIRIVLSYTDHVKRTVWKEY